MISQNRHQTKIRRDKEGHCIIAKGEKTLKIQQLYIHKLCILHMYIKITKIGKIIIAFIWKYKEA